MQKVLYLCLFLSMSLGVQGAIFFWTNPITKTAGIRFHSADVCIESYECKGCNNIDIPVFKAYIQDVLLPQQPAHTVNFLQRILALFEKPHVAIPYRCDSSYRPNEIKPFDPNAQVVSSKPKPLSAEQKKKKRFFNI